MGFKPQEWIHQIAVIEEMFRDRGYTSIKLIAQGNDIFQLCIATDSKGDIVSTYLTNEGKVGVKSVRKIRDECKKNRYALAILVCPNGLTPFATKEMGMEGDAPQIDVFKKAQLAFNVTKHNLVPRHIPLSVTEKRKLLQRLDCKANSLPKIKVDDPVIHYYGLPIGTVVSIERTLGALETEPYYRLVV